MRPLLSKVLTLGLLFSSSYSYAECLWESESYVSRCNSYGETLAELNVVAVRLASEKMKAKEFESKYKLIDLDNQSLRLQLQQAIERADLFESIVKGKKKY